MSDHTDIVFVAGASRSGTTMLARVLGLHDCLYTLGETHFFGDISNCSPSEPALTQEQARRILASLFARQVHGPFRDAIGDESYRLADEILRKNEIMSSTALFEIFARTVASMNGKQVPVEQTPRNVFFARSLLELYPNSRFIEIVRDPRAVLNSQRNRWRIRFAGGSNTPLFQSLRVLINYHAVTMSGLWVSAIRAGLNLKDHPRFLSVRYEDIVEQPEASLCKICSYLGVDFQETMLQAPQATSSTRAVGRETRGFYRSSLSEWKDRLPRGDRALCELITRKYAALHGYHFASARSHYLNVLLHMLRYPLHIMGVILLNPRRLIVQIRSVFN